MPDKQKEKNTRGPNKANKILKEVVRNFCEGNAEAFKDAFKELGAKEKCDVYLKALSYCIPTIKAVDFKDNTPANKSGFRSRIKDLVDPPEETKKQ